MESAFFIEKRKRADKTNKEYLQPTVKNQRHENSEVLQDQPSSTTPFNENKIELSQLVNFNELVTKSPNIELDAQEIDKLFGILYESDSNAFVDILGHEKIMFKPVRWFAPYPVHHQLFMRQQQEQERRRQSLTMSSFCRTTTTSKDFHNTCKNRDARLVYSVVYRGKIVRTIISFIDQYSTRMFSSHDDCNEKCVICMYSYQMNQNIRKLLCNHKFHRKCIDEWLVKSYLCPVCRKDLTGTGKVYKGIAVLYHMWKQEKCDSNQQIHNSNISIGQNHNVVFKDNASDKHELKGNIKNQITIFKNSHSDGQTSESCISCMDVGCAPALIKKTET